MPSGARAGRPRPSLRRVLTRSLGALVVAASAVTAAVPFDDTPPVEAAPDEIIAFVVEGTGLGHGRGMSQWGAFGYAVDHGWSWQQILDHYYGGTTLGDTAAGQRIRVRLLGYDGLGTVGVLSHGQPVVWNGKQYASMYAVETAAGTFDVYGSNQIACPSTVSLTVPDGPVTKDPDTYQAAAEQIQRFLKTFHDDGIVIDGYFGNQTEGVLASWQSSVGLPVDGTTWNADDAAKARQLIDAAGASVTWTKLGTHVQTPGNPVRFTLAGGAHDAAGTARDQVIGVCSASGAVTHYRGAIEVVDADDGNRVANDVLVESYVRGVVPKEVAANWGAAGDGAGMHALRAQAVAARSYGLSQNRSYTYRGSSTQYATTCDSTSCQVYGGSAKRGTATGTATRVEQDLTDQAITDTANKVRKWSDGSVVSTEFSASNGPRTAGGQFPPVDDIGDDTEDNPNHRWTRIFDAHSFASAQGLGTITSVGTQTTTSSQYQGFDGIWFDDLVVTGTTGTYRKQAWDVRQDYGLPSPGFTVRAITASPTGKDLGFVGDSVGNSIAHSGDSEFRRITDGTYATASIDVVDSRCTTNTSCPGTSGVEAVADLPTGLDLVLVELGYNDHPPSFADDIDAMMTALMARGAKQVAWVNMADIRTSGGSSFYAASNAALDAATSRWGALTVLDWDAASDNPERSRWFSDGVHLTSTGQAEFALWLREELLALTPPHYLSPPKKIELPVVGETLTAPDGSTLTVPDDATGVALNVTVVRPSARGYATVWPCQDERPLVSSLNFENGDIRANNVVAPLSEDGTVCLYSSVGTEIIVDIAGWFDGDPDAGTDPFVGLVPDRRVDTRKGIGGRTGAVTPTTPVEIPIIGTTATLPDGSTIEIPAGTAAVALNVGVTQPDRRGFVTAWGCDGDRPLASNVNFDAGAIVSNGVIAPVGSDGSVCIHVDADAQLIVDLAGFFDGGGGSDTSLTDPAFRAATPTRLVDTRRGLGSGSAAFVSPGGPLRIPVRGASLDDGDGTVTVPADASAVALNLAVVQPTARGFATVWPCSADRPLASNLNYETGRNIANSVVAPIGDDGTICVYVSQPAHVILDVAGWFRGGDTASFVGAVPERLVDTRFGVGPIPE